MISKCIKKIGNVKLFIKCKFTLEENLKCHTHQLPLLYSSKRAGDTTNYTRNQGKLEESGQARGMIEENARQPMFPYIISIIHTHICTAI